MTAAGNRSHNTENTNGSGAQAPLHADVDVSLAHEYALTRVNLREPASSKLVVRMAIDRHNCFGGDCERAAEGASCCRITLPQDDDAFMPAEGKTPLTDAQIRIIEWWIAAGMPHEMRMDQVELQPGADVQELIRSELDLPPGS